MNTPHWVLSLLLTKSHHMGVVSLFTAVLICFSFLSPLFFMNRLRVGTLNINGGRDRKRQAVVIQYIKQKNIDVAFLQETHSDEDNMIEWRMRWENQLFFSHGTNFSTGVAILISSRLKVNVTRSIEIEQGRVIMIQAEIERQHFLFLNVYASNKGSERVKTFYKIKDAVTQHGNNHIVVMGGDWNCTEDFTVDRNTEEPHTQSSDALTNIIKICGLVDPWREKNQGIKQYTWIKTTEERISAARLDRFYVTKTYRNKILTSVIHPSGFSDHHMAAIDFTLSDKTKPRFYWCFNSKLLQDQNFCFKFLIFWEEWRRRKGDFTSLGTWWEVGKVQIKIFCQQYTAHTNAKIRGAVEHLEREITNLENEMFANNKGERRNFLEQKKKALSSFLHDQAKGALIRSQISNIKDIDAPTSYFFKLERRTRRQNQMLYLKRPDGSTTTSSEEMRRIAVEFYKDLYHKEATDLKCSEELMKDLPRLLEEQKEALDTDIELQELSTAVKQLSTGRAPGIDGLPAEFYKHFWEALGADLHKVFNWSFNNGKLPMSCTRAALSLLPKKGDLGVLKNWRPVALLCTDYKILSKCLSNRLKDYIGGIIHTSQTYCIPGRTIMDNVFTVRDMIELCKTNSYDLGFLSLDQEKAFDRVDHIYLFNTLKAFGMGTRFTAWVKLLYTDACIVLKVGGGLSYPFKIQRGIRQGCPLSGQLYSLAIEPLLHQLRKNMTGLSEYGIANKVVTSAYADDILVFISKQDDMHVLSNSLRQYQAASSARVNWSKCEGLIAGQWKEKQVPKLPENLQWGRTGIKYLGLYLGDENYMQKNWEGLVEKVSAKLSKWTWVLPQLSYRGRVLVANNLVASMLWHKFAALDPPEATVREIQRRILDFFWCGQHWIRAPVLYLPIQEGGQGLIDIQSRIKTFRLQTAQRLLYENETTWTLIACQLLQKVEDLKYDKHLFIMTLNEINTSKTSKFYQTVLKAFSSLLKISRTGDQPCLCVDQEPLFSNPLIPAKILLQTNLRQRFQTAGIVKLGDLRTGGIWKPTAMLVEETKIQSHRILQRIMGEVILALPREFKEILRRDSGGDQQPFPPLSISAAAERPETNGGILSFKIPKLTDFENATKRALYITSVKVTYQNSLAGVKESRWSDLLAPGSSPRGSWRSLYKPPAEKRTADLQWRIVHGAVATNRHVARIDPTVATTCPFCGREETIEHLFLGCERLGPMFNTLREWTASFDQALTEDLYIFGPKYSADDKKKICIINFLIGKAKLATWLTRKHKIRNDGTLNPDIMLKILVKTRLKIEFAYATMTQKLQDFHEVWGQGEILCSVDNNLLFLAF